MSLTRAEWMRLLPSALKNCNWQTGEDCVEVEAAFGRFHIRYRSGRKIKLGALHLSVMEVRLEFVNCPQAAVESFLQHFDRCFLRGGG